MNRLTRTLWVLGTTLLWGTYVLSVLSFRQAQASRNAAGTYSTPNTFVTGTTISSTNMNANFSDIATEMTDSLDRSGKGGMLAALRGIDGTQAAPAYSWTSETGTGLFRNASNDVRFSVGGTSKTFWGTLGFGIGLAPTTLLHVQGSVISASKGQGYFKGVGDHGYLTIDTDSPTTKEAGLVLDQNGTRLWEIYIPANSNDLRFYNGTDRFTLTSSGLTLANALTVTGATTLGTGGSAITAANFSTCLTNGGTPSNCTITIVSGQVCVCTLQNSNNVCSFGGSGTTGTLTAPNGITATATAFCVK